MAKPKTAKKASSSAYKTITPELKKKIESYILQMQRNSPIPLEGKCISFKVLADGELLCNGYDVIDNLSKYTMACEVMSNSESEGGMVITEIPIANGTTVAWTDDDVNQYLC